MEYELIDISFDFHYDSMEEPMPLMACDGDLVPAETTRNIEYDANGVPMGRTREEIKIREKVIKDFYACWIAEHPDKSVLNKFLNSKILVKYQSINETYSKAARTYESTCAVFRLTDILANAELVEELEPKNNKNQKQYEKMLSMRFESAKLIVGLQRSNKDLVQYSITVPQA